MDDKVHQVVKGYELLTSIGQGGYGAVYRAYQSAVSREVAIKVILAQYASQPDFIRRFEIEAQLVARLEHPHIVPLYDYWRDPDGAFLVMRLLRGGSLRGALQNGRLDRDSIIRIVEQVAYALAVAHQNGVVHRDVKPANILLDEYGNAYLSDFGIAKVVGTESQTSDGIVRGSLEYIAPEQLTGVAITPQTDLYGLGVVVFELLAGHHPFGEASTSELIYRHLQTPLPDITLENPALPEAVNEVIQQATAKDPVWRFSDALSFAKAFEKAFHDTSILLAPQDRTTTATARSAVIVNPFKGLRAFDEADAADFFGRRDLTEQLVQRFAEAGPLANFLAVVGPSGSGKSSVVRAGLLPALRHGALQGSERWFVASFEPGDQPLVNLEAALLSVASKPIAHLEEQLRADVRGLLWAIDNVLPNGEGGLLLFIDQFEEVFTRVNDEAERTRFLEQIHTALLQPSSPLRVIITLRADFLDRPLQYKNFGELIRRRTEFVLPLAPEGIERAIAGPVERIGLQVEPELVAAIVGDVQSEPGALPLLQFALTEVFEQRQGGVLTLEAYRSSGGVLAALARRAEEVYASFNEAQKEVVRQIFLRLVTLGEGGEPTRRRVLRSELASVTTDASDLEFVLEVFSRHRLLTFDRDSDTREPTVEVAHEALIREWNQLLEWLQASGEDIRVQRRVAAAAAEWQRAGRDPSFLAQGSRLDHFQSWRSTTDLSLDDDERDFLDASIAARAIREAQERRQARALAQARVAAAIILVVLVGAIAVTQAARAEEVSRQASRALAAEESASRRAQEAQSIALAAGALNANVRDQIEAVSLAVLGNTITDPPALAQQILSEVAYQPGAIRVFGSVTGQVQGSEPDDLAFEVLEVSGDIPDWNGLAISPDGHWALAASEHGYLVLWNIETGTAERVFSGHTGSVEAVDFSPDGRTALSGSEDGTLLLWEVATGERLATLTGHTAGVQAVQFSPDGIQALSGSSDATVILWDVSTATPILTLTGHQRPVYGVVFTPDGRSALSASADNTIIHWDLVSGDILDTFTGHSLRVNSISVSPDGQWALSSSDDRTAILWDISTARSLRTFSGHTDGVENVTFSPDGRTALSGSEDGRVILWDVSTGELIHAFSAHSDDVDAVAFSPSGRTMLSASEDGQIILWSLDEGAVVKTLRGHADAVLATEVLASDNWALSASDDSTLILWDVTNGEVLRTFTGHSDAVNDVALSPNGQTAISASHDGSLILWDLNTATAMQTYSIHTSAARAVAISPDGASAISAAEDGSLILWDIETGEQRRAFDGHSDFVVRVVFSQDGNTALSASVDGTLILWDVASGDVIRVLRGHLDDVRAVALSPDGRMAISGSSDTTLLLWDLSTGDVLQSFVGHTDDVHGVAFSPDGQFALSASEDRTLIFWEVATGRAVRMLEGHRSDVRDVVFGANGRTALSASDDGTLKVWRIDDFAELLEWVRENRHVRELTCFERRLYLVDEPCVARTPALDSP